MNTFIQYPEVGSRYRHYKGGLYEVITLATSPESRVSIDAHQKLRGNSNYQGFQGSSYRVITMATHSETDELLVVYESLAFGTVYTMPLSNWLNESYLTETPSSSKEQLVIYQSLLFGSVHARPLSMWFDPVKQIEGMVTINTTRFSNQYVSQGHNSINIGRCVNC